MAFTSNDHSFNSQYVRKLIDLILFKTDKQAQELAKEWGMSKQQLSTMKSSKGKQLQKIVEWKEAYGLTWEEVGNALEHDYSKGDIGE